MAHEIYCAVRDEGATALEALLAAGADIDATTGGRTALLLAAAAGDVASVHRLVVAGADVGAVDVAARASALDLATRAGHGAAAAALRASAVRSYRDIAAMEAARVASASSRAGRVQMARGTRPGVAPDVSAGVTATQEADSGGGRGAEVPPPPPQAVTRPRRNLDGTFYVYPLPPLPAAAAAAAAGTAAVMDPPPPFFEILLPPPPPLLLPAPSTMSPHSQPRPALDVDALREEARLRRAANAERYAASVYGGERVRELLRAPSVSTGSGGDEIEAALVALARQRRLALEAELDAARDVRMISGAEAVANAAFTRAAAAQAAADAETARLAGPRSGWMYKRGRIRRNWKRRWFVLEGHDLVYRTQPKGGARKGALLLDYGTSILNFPRRPHSFAIRTPKRELVCAADSEEDKRAWEAVLRAHCSTSVLDPDHIDDD